MTVHARYAGPVTESQEDTRSDGGYEIDLPSWEPTGSQVDSGRVKVRFDREFRPDEQVRIKRPESTEPGELVPLEANITDEFGNTSVTWRFDDGSVAVCPLFTYSSDPGEYAVTVRVVYEYGVSNRSSAQFVAGSRDPFVQDMAFMLGFDGRLVLVALLALVIIGLLRWMGGQWPRPLRRRSR